MDEDAENRSSVVHSVQRLETKALEVSFVFRVEEKVRGGW